MPIAPLSNLQQWTNASYLATMARQGAYRVAAIASGGNPANDTTYAAALLAADTTYFNAIEAANTAYGLIAPTVDDALNAINGTYPPQ